MDVDKIRDLYLGEGLSAREVGEKLGKTTWQVIRFLKKYHIPRRTPTETLQIQFHKKPLSYKWKVKMTPSEKTLFEVGIMLYWAEGVKAGNHVVDFANSNERMILIFLSMLRNICQVQEDKLRVLLYCYANQEVDSLKKFWSTKLSIPLSQFIKPYVRHDFDDRKIYKMPYGLVHIRYHDKKLFMQIQKNIDIISSRIIQCWDDGAVKRTCL